MRVVLLIWCLIILPTCLVASTNPVRFVRAANGIITDTRTGLQWLEGPDRKTTWNQAQIWINSLGNSWRMPTRAELGEIYIASSSRYVEYYQKHSETSEKLKVSDKCYLGLDPAFNFDSVVFVCAEKISKHFAWYFIFSEGQEFIRFRDNPGFPIFVNWKYTRALAVRGPRKVIRLNQKQKRNPNISFLRKNWALDKVLK